MGARDLAQDGCLDTADLGHGFGREILDLGLQRLEARDIGLDILLVIEFLLDDRVNDRVEHGDVAAGLEAQRMGGVAHHVLAARVHDDQFGAALGRLLEIRSEEHTSELQSLMHISYAVFCLKKKTYKK